MIDSVISEIKLIKDEIKQIKIDSATNINENSASLRKEIDDLRKEIYLIKNNDIQEDLKDELQNEKCNVNKLLQQMGTITQKHENQYNRINNLQIEIADIIKEMKLIKESQAKKVDETNFVEIKKDIQNLQLNDKSDKEKIQNELFQLKQIVNKINHFHFYLDYNSRIFGTNWKLTKELHSNGTFKSPEFFNQINEFAEFNVEIKYPSDDFEEIFEEILELKNSHKVNLTISILTTENKINFNGQKEIKSIKFDSSVVKIENRGLCGCSSLSNILIPSSVTSIGEYAFQNCSQLTNISIPSSVASIGYYAFKGCSLLTNISIPSSVTSIGNFAFSRCSLSTVSVPSSVTSIGRGAFSKCSLLSSISIPSTIKSFESFIFSECTSLSTISIPSSVTYIGDHCFSKCTLLTKISIPSSVTSIGDH